MMNCYKTLRINPNATEDEIKIAYKNLVKIYHPDRYENSSDEQKRHATKIMQEINKAKVDAIRNLSKRPYKTFYKEPFYDEQNTSSDTEDFFDQAADTFDKIFRTAKKSSSIFKDAFKKTTADVKESVSSLRGIYINTINQNLRNGFQNIDYTDFYNFFQEDFYKNISVYNLRKIAVLESSTEIILELYRYLDKDALIKLRDFTKKSNDKKRTR